jgi:hypothetical protein
MRVESAEGVVISDGNVQAETAAFRLTLIDLNFHEKE